MSTKPAAGQIVAETYEPGMSVSLVARRHGIAPNQVFSWRLLANQGALQQHFLDQRKLSGKR